MKKIIILMVLVAGVSIDIQTGSYHYHKNVRRSWRTQHDHTHAHRQHIVVAWDIDDVLLHDGRPCSSAFDVVRALHNKGVRQVLFTNKSPDGFKQLQSDCPGFFNRGYFDMSRSVIGGGLLEKKPYAPNYQTILKYNEGDRIIFFDDKEKNVSAAKGHGMDAHVWVYNCRKSASHARSVLRHHNVL